DKSGPGKFSYDIRVFHSVDEGKNWNNSFLLNDDGLEAEHGFVSMTPLNGNVFFTWLDGRQTANASSTEPSHDSHHGSMSLRAGIRSFSGEKISEWLIDDRTCDCCQTTAAVFNNRPLVIYRDRSETEIRDMAVSRFESGIWSTPSPVSTDGWQVKGCPVNGPRVAVAGKNIASAWFTSANGQPAVYVAISGDGGKNFGERVRIDEGNANGRVDITPLGDDFIVCWLEGEEIRIKRLFKDGSSGKSSLIATSSSSRTSGFPQLTTLSELEVIMAWTDITLKRIRTKVIRPE
ncbi:MAG: exo-alpha-sialidase, partial [Cyclobacteriaceae bacterium]